MKQRCTEIWLWAIVALMFIMTSRCDALFAPL